MPSDWRTFLMFLTVRFPCPAEVQIYELCFFVYDPSLLADLANNVRTSIPKSFKKCTFLYLWSSFLWCLFTLLCQNFLHFRKFLVGLLRFGFVLHVQLKWQRPWISNLRRIFFLMKQKQEPKKSHISCSWVHCATFFTESAGRPFLFTDRPEKQKLVDEVEILLSVKFRWIQFSGFKWEVENVSANQNWDGHLVFSNRPKKHKYSRGLWDLDSYQVSINSVLQVTRGSRKCLSQSETGAAILIFRSTRKKTTNLVEDITILLPVKFHWIPFSGFRGKVQNVLANQRPGWTSRFFALAQKT